MGLGLIVAIGAQNAFVLKQGLLGRHVLAVCLTCAVSDAILITVGVTSFGRVTEWLPWLEPAMRTAGALFLFLYGGRSLLAALRTRGGLQPDAAGTYAGSDRANSLGTTLLTCLAITWLNPHVYLDTVVMLGTVSSQYEGARGAFAGGAIAGSFLFFFALGYGARGLQRLLARPLAWRLLEATIGVLMWLIAAQLALGE
ncbi:LysE/ArgO family amino acid transporter [Spiribacter vilamensis]|uniref:LysE/ArgO family amino acid transporter n=1 Tax=Spiribacter vilamensis TaxID=531306 RepID=UPI001EF11B4F|nr:LysE/ArgO family amino acid transporter [Spiribacter vilamensis]